VPSRRHTFSSRLIVAVPFVGEVVTAVIVKVGVVVQFVCAWWLTICQFAPSLAIVHDSLAVHMYRVVLPTPIVCEEVVDMLTAFVNVVSVLVKRNTLPELPTAVGSVTVIAPDEAVQTRISVVVVKEYGEFVLVIATTVGVLLTDNHADQL